MTKDRIKFLREMSPGTSAEFEECLDEIERLQSGRLTPEEFNELCHNLHEQGRPLSREEHEAECEKFRDELFSPPMHYE